MPQLHVDPILPSDHDATLARAAQAALERSESPDRALRIQLDAAGHETATLDLPPIVAQLLVEILKETAAGNAVSLVTVEAEMTTQQAADLLDVSRSYLIGMIDEGVLPARMVGDQRRLPLRDVLAYKADRRAKRHKTLDEMAALDQEFGLI